MSVDYNGILFRGFPINAETYNKLPSDVVDDYVIYMNSYQYPEDTEIYFGMEVFSCGCGDTSEVNMPYLFDIMSMNKKISDAALANGIDIQTIKCKWYLGVKVW